MLRIKYLISRNSILQILITAGGGTAGVFLRNCVLVKFDPLEASRSLAS